MEKLNLKIYSQENQKFGKAYDYYHQARMERIFDFFQGLKGNLLDLGCGTVSISKAFEKNPDWKSFHLDMVKENVTNKKNGVQCNLAHVALPFKDDSFDVVFAGEVIEHIVETDELLAELHRILKPRGVLIASTPNLASWYNRILLMLGFMPHWVESGSKKAYGTPFGVISGHVKGFTKRSLLELLAANKFKKVKLKGTYFKPLPEDNATSGLFFAKTFTGIDWFFSHAAGLSSDLVILAQCEK